MAKTQEQYEKIKQYLLDNGQQELTGHLQGLWNELNDLRGESDAKDDRETSQSFQDRASNADEDGKMPKNPPLSSDEPGMGQTTAPSSLGSGTPGAVEDSEDQPA